MAVSGKIFNRDLRLSKGCSLYINDVQCIDGDGVINATASTVNWTTTGNTALGDTSGDTLTINATTTASAPVTVGVDDTGHDVKFFGATSGKYFLWDESADQVVLQGSIAQTGNTTHIGTVTVGVDATGHDVKFFGDTTGKSLLWDESADTLIITGNLTTTMTTTLSGKLIADGTTTSTGAGAVAITGTIHEITTTGTGDALTLADGTEGQILNIVYKAEGAGGDTAVCTPTSLAGGTTITFNALGDTATLLFTAGEWYKLGGAAAIA